jgi:prepilin-type N-terminal cleavage/methylation domain-containing protein
MQSLRAGFTLIEVLVAIVLIEVGLLALVAGSAVLVRQTSEVRARSNALRAATARIEALGAGPCVSTSGASTVGDVHELWSVDLQANHVREVRDSVAFTAAGIGRSLALRTRLPC